MSTESKSIKLDDQNFVKVYDELQQETLNEGITESRSDGLEVVGIILVRSGLPSWLPRLRACLPSWLPRRAGCLAERAASDRT